MQLKTDSSKQMLENSLHFSEADPNFDFRNSLDEKINFKLEKLGIPKMRGGLKKDRETISIIKQSTDYDGSVPTKHRHQRSSFLPNLKLKLNSNR